MLFALNILYTKEKETCAAYVSKINSNCEKQISLLIISEKEKKLALSCSDKTSCITQSNNLMVTFIA